MRTGDRTRRLPLVLLVALFGLGCQPKIVIEGVVEDVHGKTLPGVAVSLAGTPVQALSDGIGRYQLACPPDILKALLGAPAPEILAIKTGYAPRRIPMTLAGEGQALTAPLLRLWPLPAAEGVFFLVGQRYVRLSPASLKQYRTRELGPRFGTKKDTTSSTLHPRPRIFLHKMKPYDAQLTRLEQIDAAELDENREGPEAKAGEFPERVWVAAASVAVSSVVLDEENRALLELRLEESLVPGIYAVHWGGLDGHLSTDSRVFLFQVKEPDAERKPSPPE